MPEVSKPTIENIWLLDEAGKKSTLMMTAFAGESSLVAVGYAAASVGGIVIAGPLLGLLVVSGLLAGCAWFAWRGQAFIARNAAASLLQGDAPSPVPLLPFSTTRCLPETTLLFAVQVALVVICLT